MALIVQKFGGTSVGSVPRILEVARWALKCQGEGHQIVVVVSAMAGETNRLVGLAKDINPNPYSREYDLLLASGEQVAVGLVALAINTLAGRSVARGFLGHQLGILTDSVYSKARIQGIRAEILKTEIARGVIPVIAGFQGVDVENNITTLGRGGSDTSAVAIAAAIGADDCEIYTDVDGIYTTDPRLCPQARKLKEISYEEMMELASQGAKVLQIRSVELAANYKVPLVVRSSFSFETPGTRVIEAKGGKMEQVIVAGVAADSAQVKWTLQNVPDRPDAPARIFKTLSDASIVVDIIVQNINDHGKGLLSFTVSESDQIRTRAVLEDLKRTSMSEITVSEEAGLAKVSIVGVGMQHHPGVASRMFEILASQGIKIKLITTSEIKISCLIDASSITKAVQSLHNGFQLDQVD